MIRENASADARFVHPFRVPDHGPGFGSRIAAGGAVTGRVATGGPAP